MKYIHVKLIQREQTIPLFNLCSNSPRAENYFLEKFVLNLGKICAKFGTNLATSKVKCEGFKVRLVPRFKTEPTSKINLK